MRQVPKDKYTVAWFKLAEFVQRGEKERALGLYRLLIHSFENKALALQLEGDILLAFKDYQAATERYLEAATQYEQETKLIEAAAIHEHIVLIQSSLAPNIRAHIQSCQKLIEYYHESGNTERLVAIIANYCVFLAQQHDCDKLLQKLAQFEHLVGADKLASVYQECVIALCSQKHETNAVSAELFTPFLQKIFENGDLDKYSEFLQKIKAMREDVYAAACELLQKN